VSSLHVRYFPIEPKLGYLQTQIDWTGVEGLGDLDEESAILTTLQMLYEIAVENFGGAELINKLLHETLKEEK